MERLISEIRAALNNGAYVLALHGTLAAVDICGALESADGESRGERFKDWFTRHLSPVYPWFSADDAWKLRCGILHQGRVSAKQYKAIIFTLPNAANNVFHNNVLNDALNLDLRIFCSDVLGAIDSWWLVAKDLDPVKTNAESLVQVRPGGLSPYIVGTPVLA